METKKGSDSAIESEPLLIFWPVLGHLDGSGIPENFPPVPVPRFPVVSSARLG
jgi:hypothetical protein